MRKRWVSGVYIDSGNSRCDMRDVRDSGSVSGVCDMCGMQGGAEASLSMVRLGGTLICEHCERALVSADPYAKEYDAVARLLRRAMFGMVIAGA